MAVDSQAKRMSATFLLLPVYTQGIVPDGSVDQNDRQAAIWVYGGILASTSVAGQTLAYAFIGNTYGTAEAGDTYSIKELGSTYSTGEE